MAWIELHQGIFRHRKVVRLAGALQVSRFESGAHVICLWLWALDNAPDGDLSRLEATEIAVGAEWEGDAKAFVAAMEQAGLFDRTKRGLVIHDWVDYVGRLMEQREANKTRQKRFRDRKRNALRNGYVTGERNAPVTVTSRDTVPNPTVPNPTVPNPTPIPSPQEGDPPASPVVPRPRKTFITEDFITEMVTEFRAQYDGDQDVRDTIANAMNHEAFVSKPDKRMYVRNWLKNEPGYRAKRGQVKAPLANGQKPSPLWDDDEPLTVREKLKAQGY